MAGSTSFTRAARNFLESRPDQTATLTELVAATRHTIQPHVARDSVFRERRRRNPNWQPHPDIDYLESSVRSWILMNIRRVRWLNCVQIAERVRVGGNTDTQRMSVIPAEYQVSIKPDHVMGKRGPKFGGGSGKARVCRTCGARLTADNRYTKHVTYSLPRSRHVSAGGSIFLCVTCGDREIAASEFVKRKDPPPIPPDPNLNLATIRYAKETENG